MNLLWRVQKLKRRLKYTKEGEIRKFPDNRLSKNFKVSLRGGWWSNPDREKQGGEK